MNNLINKKAFEKMQETKNSYIKNLKYKIDSQDFLSGNYGSKIFLIKNCKQYVYHVMIEYNINKSVDDIIIVIEKHSKKLLENIETKKRYIPIN